MIDKANFSFAVSWLYPTADRELLQVWSDHVVWLFIFDDILEETESIEKFEDFSKEAINIAKRFPRKLDNNSPANDQFKLKRFVEYFEHYLKGCRKERLFRQSGRMPSIKEYSDYRYASVGMFNYLLGTEFVQNTINETVEHSKIQRLLEITVLHFFRINDLFSLGKDKQQGLPNYVIVIQNEKKISEEQAVEIVLAEIEQLTAEFKSIYSEIKQENNSNMNDYCEGMIEFMIGNIE
ncbi:9086_t:CDS:2 [Ambispora gerdemannii]|uniref:Terpene synthase n=1 Tax=Ambispora gerdemannii TaxID=144530 RepID=A0A9N8YQM2_9GLOM|nr:9086_t:CDS:2 [Ambispora gerdemannii]